MFEKTKYNYKLFLNFLMYFSIGWNQHKKSIENSFIRSSGIWLILTPIAAKSLENIEKIYVPWLDNAIVIALPFSWVIFFFASLSFTISTVLYNLSCPVSIKEYQSVQDFIDKDFTASKVHSLFIMDLTYGMQGNFKNDPIMIRRRDSLLSNPDYEKNSAKLNTARKEMTKYYENMAAHSNYNTLRIDELVDKKNLGYSFELIRKLSNYNLGVVRHAISFFTAIGFVGIGIVLLQNVIFVYSHWNL